MSEKKQEQEIENQEEVNETEVNEEKSESEKEVEPEIPDFSNGFDYSDVLEDNDLVSVNGQKIKWADIKSKFNNMSTEKKAEIVEENPQIKKEIEKVAEKQAQEQEETNENNLTEEQKVLVKLLEREYVREWNGIKDKYPLVDFDDVIAKLQTQEQKDPSQVEIVAKKLQSYFDKKLELKEKTKLEGKKKAEETNFNIGESPSPSPKGEEEVPDIEDTSAFVNSVKNFFRKK